MPQPSSIAGRSAALPVVRRIGVDRPAAWLKAGWQDILANPLPSIAYGLLFSIGGDLILLGSLKEPYLFMTAISGFFLVAPILSAGLYELSRQRAQGLSPGFLDSIAAVGRAAPALALFGALVALVAVLWERISALSFAMVGDLAVEAPQFIWAVITNGQHQAFAAVWFITGAVLAMVTFAFSVVSVPLLLDRETDFGTAILTSLRAFFLNLDALVLWGAMILFFTLFGFLTLLAGLVITMPLLGHASWHAYRELVK